MTNILFNKSTHSISAITNAVNYYKNAYRLEKDTTKWDYESHYVKRQIASQDGAIYTSKARKRAGRPPKRWYRQITADDVHSILFKSVEDKVAFLLKWG